MSDEPHKPDPDNVEEQSHYNLHESRNSLELAEALFAKLGVGFDEHGKLFIVYPKLLKFQENHKILSMIVTSVYF